MQLYTFCRIHGIDRLWWTAWLPTSFCLDSKTSDWDDRKHSIDVPFHRSSVFGSGDGEKAAVSSDCMFHVSCPPLWSLRHSMNCRVQAGSRKWCHSNQPKILKRRPGILSTVLQRLYEYSELHFMCGYSVFRLFWFSSRFLIFVVKISNCPFIRLFVCLSFYIINNNPKKLHLIPQCRIPVLHIF